MGGTHENTVVTPPTARLATRAVLALGTFACLLALAGTRAEALAVHRFQASFGGPGSAPGQLNEPRGVAVNDSTALAPAAGDVYVADSGNSRIERFSAAGQFLGWFDGSGEYEVEKELRTDTAAGHGGRPNEVQTGRLSRPEMIAVDDSGSPTDPSNEDVYVFDQGNGVIDKFGPLGEYLGQITGAGAPCEAFEAGEANKCSVTGLAVDPAGLVWASVVSGPIYAFSSAIPNVKISECVTPFGGTSNLAVDESDDLYLLIKAGHGTPNGEFGETDSKCNATRGIIGTAATAVAVDYASKLVYFDSRAKIESFDLEDNPIESDEPEALAPSFGEGKLDESTALAVDSATGSVYAANAAGDDVSVFDDIALPTPIAGAVDHLSPKDVTLNGTVDPEGKPVTECLFEYDTTPYRSPSEGPHGTSVVCSPGNLGSGSEPVPVSAELKGLTPETEYYYRVRASSATGGISSGGKAFFAGPLVEGEWTAGVSSESVTIDTRINPNGDVATYFVEYGLTPAFGLYAPLEPPGAKLGSGASPQLVSTHLQGLGPATKLFYKVVVVQNGETFGCTDVSKLEGECDTTFRTFAGPTQGMGLIDGRGWELVSPPDKRGAVIHAETDNGAVLQAASDGGGVAYMASGPHLGNKQSLGHVAFSQELSRRSGGAWETEELTLPDRLLEDGEPAVGTSLFSFEYSLFSPTLSSVLVEPQLAGTPPLSGETDERTLYTRNNDSREFHALISSADAASAIEPFNEEHQQWGVDLLAASPNLEHVVFKTPEALVEPAIDEEAPTVSCQALETEFVNLHPGQKAPRGDTMEPNCFEEAHVQVNLYEWDQGILSLVNVLPNERPAHGRYGSSVPNVTLAGAEIIQGTGIERGGMPRTMSTDGSRVAWTWGEPCTPAELQLYKGLYVRDLVGGHTVQVGGKEAIYQTMSADGTKIFYLEKGELYVYDWPIGAETGTAAGLTQSHGSGEAGAGVEEAVSDVSEDGSYVYFVAQGVLAPGGVGGDNNLYLLHETEGVWSTRYVAGLADVDRPSWYANSGGTENAPSLAFVSSRVSPDGRFLAFMSQRPLTGYDNVDAASGQRDEEVFLYDAQTNQLVCASCDSSGARPDGVFDDALAELEVDGDHILTAARGGVDHWLAGSIPGWEDREGRSPMYQPRYLSNSGRLFFDSPDSMVPADSNGLEDVYEFEPEGIGGCSSATSSSTQVFVGEVSGRVVDGCVGLVSSGSSRSESAFLDASESGDDVFFVTTGKLVPEDYDSSYDVYDAHVCSTSVPCASTGLPPTACVSGDSCKPPPSLQPEIFGSPASMTFEGIGNVGLTAPSTATHPKRGGSSASKRIELERALKKCRRHRSKRRRAACERKARRAYGESAATKKRTKAGRAGRGSR